MKNTMCPLDGPETRAVGLRPALHPSPPHLVRPPLPIWRRLVARLLAAISVASCLACDERALLDHTRSIATEFRLIDAETETPLFVDVCLDLSPGSPSDAGRVSAILDLVANEAVERPGSLVRVWVFGDEPSEVQKIANVEVPAFSSLSGAARRSKIALIRAELGRAASFRFPTGAEPTNSPVIESMAAVVLDDSGRKPTSRLLLVLTDGKERYRYENFECGELPTPDMFGCRLVHFAGLTDSSFSDVDVVLVGVRPIPNADDRCPITLVRAAAIRELWRAGLYATGARSIEIQADVPQTLAIPQEEIR